MLSSVKRMLKRLVSVPAVNRFVRSVVELPLGQRVLPRSLIRRCPVVVDSFTVALPNDTRLRIRADGKDLIAQQLYWEGLAGYEPESLRVFMILLNGSHTVFDVGAYTGLYGVIAALDDPSRRVYAFEPRAEVAARVESAAMLNELDNLEVVRAAVSDVEGEVDFYVPSASSGIPTDVSLVAGFRTDRHGIRVSSITLDGFVARNQIDRVGLVKIDTEATEHLVLRGGRRTLQRDHPIFLCEVLHGQTERALQDVLDEFGYSYFWISARGLVRRSRIVGDPQYRFLNYVFITAERLEELRRTPVALPIVDGAAE